MFRCVFCVVLSDVLRAKPSPDIVTFGSKSMKIQVRVIQEIVGNCVLNTCVFINNLINFLSYENFFTPTVRCLEFAQGSPVLQFALSRRPGLKGLKGVLRILHHLLMQLICTIFGVLLHLIFAIAATTQQTNVYRKYKRHNGEQSNPLQIKLYMKKYLKGRKIHQYWSMLI